MTSLSNLKIAISGPNASGKTTIADLLAKELNLQLISEEVGDIFSHQRLYLEICRNSQSKEKILSAKKEWIRSFFKWSQLRNSKYSNCTGFIADRWEADLLDFWLVNFGREPHLDQLTVKLFKNFQAKAKNLDLAIIMPFKQPYTKNQNESKLNRVSSFSNRLLNSVVTTGIIYTAPSLRILRIPQNLSNADDCLDFILSQIRKNSS